MVTSLDRLVTIEHRRLVVTSLSTWLHRLVVLRRLLVRSLKPPVAIVAEYMVTSFSCSIRRLLVWSLEPPVAIVAEWLHLSVVTSLPG